MPAATGFIARKSMATDWSEEAKARRSASAKKAAETRKAKRLLDKPGMKEAIRENAAAMREIKRITYFQNSRVARWALSGVSLIAMMRGVRSIRWDRPTLEMRMPLNPEMLRG